MKARPARPTTARARLRPPAAWVLGLLVLACGRDPLLTTPLVPGDAGGRGGGAGFGGGGGGRGGTAGDAGRSDVAADVGDAGVISDLRPGEYQLVILPDNGPKIPVGKSLRMRAVVKIGMDWRDLGGEALLVWQSDDPLVADVAARNGQVTGVKAGNTVIHASHPFFGAGQAAVVVTASDVASIVIAPSPLALVVGETRALSATAVYEDGSSGDVTSAAMWSTDDQRFARVQNGVPPIGLLTAALAGDTTVAATFVGVTGSAPVSVSGSGSPTLAVGPQSASRTVGSSVRFMATLRQPTGATSDVSTLASWSSSNPGVAGVLGVGQFRCLDTGSATVGAAYMGLMAGATLECTTGMAALKELRISPAGANAPLFVNVRYRLMVEAIYSDGMTVAVNAAQVRWSSSDERIAAIDDEATLLGLAPGSVSITAAYAGVMASESYTFIPR